MTTPTNPPADDVQQLRERLKAAEDVCLMYGWSAVHDTTERDKATLALCRRWYDLVGPEFTEPRRHPHLTENHIADLARRR